MTGLTYTIGEPVEAVPDQQLPVRVSRDGWEEAYRAAERAHGKWIPVQFDDKAKARNLAESARKRSQVRFEAEVRGTVVYLRTAWRLA